MAIALRPGETEEYVTPSDQKLPPEQQTTWILGHPPYALRSWFVTAATSGSSEEQALLLAILVRCSIKGFRNWRDADGGELEYRAERLNVNGQYQDALAFDLADRIAFQDFTELAGRCTELLHLTKTEAKN